jgi:hypothetical protein
MEPNHRIFLPEPLPKECVDLTKKDRRRHHITLSLLRKVEHFPSIEIVSMALVCHNCRCGAVDTQGAMNENVAMITIVLESTIDKIHDIEDVRHDVVDVEDGNVEVFPSMLRRIGSCTHI